MIIYFYTNITLVYFKNEILKKVTNFREFILSILPRDYKFILGVVDTLSNILIHTLLFLAAITSASHCKCCIV